VLFEATWVHHGGGSSRTFPAQWSIITTPETLAVWSQRHDYLGVLTTAVLDRPAFTVLGRFDGSDLVGGAVLHEGPRTVGLSNTWTLAGQPQDWEELLAAAHAVHPGVALTDYARGEELYGLLHAGFQAVGTQRNGPASQRP
jgi:hypothetical protein